MGGDFEAQIERINNQAQEQAEHILARHGAGPIGNYLSLHASINRSIQSLSLNTSGRNPDVFRSCLKALDAVFAELEMITNGADSVEAFAADRGNALIQAIDAVIEENYTGHYHPLNMTGHEKDVPTP